MSDLPQQNDYLARARLLTDQKRWRDAEKILREALSKEPNCPEKLYLLALCQLEQKQVSLAEETAKAAIAAGPNLSNGFFILARVYIEQEYYEVALELNAEALQINPESLPYHYQRAYILNMLNHPQKALESINAALSLIPDNSDSLAFRALLLQSLGRQADARENADQSLRADPNNWFAFYSRGHAFWEEGKNTDAYTAFREALRLEPNNDHLRKCMLEALRKRYFFYRIFEWLQTRKGQPVPGWIYIPGLFFGLSVYFYVFGMLMINHPFWGAVLLSVSLLTIFYVIFGYWLLKPVTNFPLLFHPIGRLALTRKNKIAAIALISFQAVSLLFMVISACVYNNLWLQIGIVLNLLSLPVTDTISQSSKRRFVLAGAIAVTYVFLAVCLFLSQGAPWGFVFLFPIAWPFSRMLYTRYSYNSIPKEEINKHLPAVLAAETVENELHDMRQKTFLLRWLNLYARIFERNVEGISLFTIITGVYLCASVIISILLHNLFALGAVFLYLGVFFLFYAIRSLAEIIADFIILFDKKGRRLLGVQEKLQTIFVVASFAVGLLLIPVGIFAKSPLIIASGVYLLALVSPIKEIFAECSWERRLISIACLFVLIVCAFLSSTKSSFIGLFIVLAVAYYWLYYTTQE